MVVLKSVSSPHLTTCQCGDVRNRGESYLELDLAVGELPVHIVGDTFLQCDHLAPPQHAQVLPGLTVAAALRLSPPPLCRHCLLAAWSSYLSPDCQARYCAVQAGRPPAAGGLFSVHTLCSIALPPSLPHIRELLSFTTTSTPWS